MTVIYFKWSSAFMFILCFYNVCSSICESIFRFIIALNVCCVIKSTDSVGANWMYAIIDWRSKFDRTFRPFFFDMQCLWCIFRLTLYDARTWDWNTVCHNKHVMKYFIFNCIFHVWISLKTIRMTITTKSYSNQLSYTERSDSIMTLFVCE